MSWLYRNMPSLHSNWYRVDIVDKEGNVIKTEHACNDCGEALQILSELPEDVMKKVLEIKK